MTEPSSARDAVWTRSGDAASGPVQRVNEPHRWPRRLRRVLRAVVLGIAAVVGLLIAAGGTLYLLARPAIGRAAEGARLAHVERSPQWRDGQFRNRRTRIDGDVFSGQRSKFVSPNAPVPVARRTAADYRTPPASGLRVTWLGHSTNLIEIDGQRVLTDPTWSDRASPLSFVGPARFFAPPLPLDELPPVDVVVIGHDHYDHLDMATVKALSARGVRFLVPLGVGARLAGWGVPDSLVTEMDWWDSTRVGNLTITATPSRHFSGRTLWDQDHTLWAGWSIASARHRVFYSGDTALHDEFIQIGERLGPFDLTLIEVGEYSALWADVHLGPEQAVLAHRLVRGDVMLPVHWATFPLANHGWTEPMERVLVAADSQGVRVAAPQPGELMEPARLGPVVRWWPRVPWQTAAEAPTWSHGVEHLRRMAPPPG
jgi:L-ascorbate metabolism protein UlaG (beta-lactamase superfamily)